MTRARRPSRARRRRPTEECGVLGSRRRTARASPSSRSSGCSPCSTAARRPPASPSATATGRACTSSPGSCPTSSPPRRSTPLAGYHAIGHTRYSTTGASNERNIQPFLVETMHGPLALAHNGNIVNTPALRDELLPRGFGLTATSDSEVMTLMLAAAGGRTWEERIERTLPAWKGAFSLVLLAADRVLAVRDPWGFRPLSVGRLPHGGHAVASETCALSTLGCVDISEVAAGRDRHAAGRRAAPPPGARPGAAARPAARSSSSTSPGPTRSGTAATCTTSASGSAPSWPPSRRSTPTS